jgi:REP element-mobilizing transposase RayT
MTTNPESRRRRDLRLPDYDYAQSGAYFVTICTKDRTIFFGSVIDEWMHLAEPGLMVERWCREIPAKFPTVELDAFVIMPNHVHAILLIGTSALTDGAEERGGHAGPPLPEVVQWFKTMTTNAYIRGVKERGWTRFDGSLWQRSYYEHVVRNEAELTSVREYVLNNPLHWAMDREHPDRRA